MQHHLHRKLHRLGQHEFDVQRRNENRDWLLLSRPAIPFSSPRFLPLVLLPHIRNMHVKKSAIETTY
jgi:hypothetical protein